jgi:hypothetical protein
LIRLAYIIEINLFFPLKNVLVLLVVRIDVGQIKAF